MNLEMEAAPREGAAVEQIREKAGANLRPLTTAGQVRLPRDVAAIGIIIDRGHLRCIPELIRLTKNSQAIALLSGWRRLEQFDFLVFAGQLHRDTGVAGGMATCWSDALALVSYTCDRLDGIAKGGNFTSAWVPYLPDQQRQEFIDHVAQRQPIGGTA